MTDLSTLLSISCLVGLLGLMAWAMAADARTFEIPNRISVGIVLLYPIWALARGEAVQPVPALIVAGILLVCGFVAFCLRLVGGGDVKLLSAVALWAGPHQIFALLALTAVLGAVLALAYAAAQLVRLNRQSAGSAAASAEAELPRQTVLSSPIPYGVAIAMGGSYVAAALLAGLA